MNNQHHALNYVICAPPICSSNSHGSKKLPDDGRLLLKHVGASSLNKEVICSVHGVGCLCYILQMISDLHVCRVMWLKLNTELMKSNSYTVTKLQILLLNKRHAEEEMISIPS
jgi:hypothetical protein